LDSYYKNYYGNINALAAKDSIIFTANELTEYYRSSDYGDTWKQVSVNLSDPWFLTYIGDTLYAGTDGGLFYSIDNGTNWTKLDNGLSGSARCFTVNGECFFVGNANGLFFSSNRGASCTLSNSGLGSTKSVSAVGIKGNYIFIGVGNSVFRSNIP
jgi:photosystem II stability/assembly factor-like uncharacterized protein